MAQYSRFFGGDPAPEYTQPQFAEVLEKLFSNGVFKDVDDELAVSENNPVSLSVIVASGEGWINGFWYQNTEDLTKTLGAADPDNPRIDRIILRLDTTDDLEITCEVLEGTPAAEPDPPELTQEAATYEISLCQVLVAEDATGVADEDITDEREYATVPNTVDLSSVQTLTNKRVTKRVGSVASSASLTIDADSYDEYNLTALGETITVNAPTGTPTDGQTLILYFKDNGTGRTINWNAIFSFIGCDAPTGTTAGKVLIVGLKYKSALSKWVCPNAIAEEG